MLHLIEREPYTAGVMRLAWVLLALLMGSVLGAAALIRWPGAYLALSDAMGWRLGLPSVGQARLEMTLKAIHLRSDGLLDGQTTVLLGDSHLHSLPTSTLAEASTSFAIAGETAEHLALRVPDHASLARVRRVVLLSGRNDLNQGRNPGQVAQSISRTLSAIPASTPVLLLGIPPTRRSSDNKADLTETNQRIEQACAARAHCHFVPTTSLGDAALQLRDDLALSDGVHLNTQGYRQLTALINTAMKATGPAR